MKSWKPVVSGLTALSVFVLAGTVSCAKQEKHDHSAHGPSEQSQSHDPSVAPAAQSYADAVRQIRGHMASLDAIIKSGDYDAVHNDCVAIGRLSKSLAELAGRPNSPVPKDKLQEVSGAAGELAVAQRSLHSAAHDDDVPKVKEHYAHMGRLVESLARHSAGS